MKFRRLTQEEHAAYMRLALTEFRGVDDGWPESALGGRPGLAALFEQLRRLGLAKLEAGVWTALAPFGKVSTMKLTMDEVTIRTVEREIPEACPKCAANFREHGNLVEDQLTEVNQAARIIGEGEDVDLDYGDTGMNEGILVVGYRCRCGHYMVSTESREDQATGTPTGN